MNISRKNSLAVLIASIMTSTLFALPVQAGHTSLITAPTFTAIVDHVPSYTSGDWGQFGAVVTLSWYACPNSIAASAGAQPNPGVLISAGCAELSTQTQYPSIAPTRFDTPYIILGGGNSPLYSQEVDNYKHIVMVEKEFYEGYVWTASVLYGTSSPGSSSEEVPPPVYFGGPLVMGSTLPHFTQGEEGTVTLTGKRMSGILSATINGVAVTVTAERRSATITVPATLAAGTYDLVLQTTNGRLTVMRFIKVS